MCGIAGFIDFNNKLTKKDLVEMTDVLSYRGPDASGYHYEQTTDAVIGLGHRRLSILDLSPLGNQPYYYEDLVVIFNGEIYNFQEIREGLIKDGFSFKSNSDTEVIIKSYYKNGLTCVDDFIGMFSIIILDKKEQKVHCIRDRAGVKPLYYSWRNGQFLFSSELKSFCALKTFDREIDSHSIASYFHTVM